MQYTALDRCKLFKQKDFKAKGFVIIANKLAMNLSFRLDRYCLDFVTLLILLIYECISLLFILWSKTKFNFVSIKLFCYCFVQFTIIWFHSSLKQAVQPELSLFHVLQSNQLFFLFWPELGQNVTNHQRVIISFSF